MSKLIYKCLRFIYENKSKHIFVETYTDKVLLKGEFSEISYGIILENIGIIKHFKRNNIEYLQNKGLTIDANFLATGNNYEVKTGHVKLGKLDFMLTGFIIQNKNEQELQVSLKANNQYLRDVSDILSSKIQPYMNRYKLNGSANVDISISGKNSTTQSPHLSALFNIVNGSANVEEAKLSITNINLNGTFDNGANENPVIEQLFIDSFSASINGNKVSGSIGVVNFNDPNITLAAKGDISIEPLFTIADLTLLTQPEGLINANITLSGKWDYMKEYKNYASQLVKCNADMVFKGVGFEAKNGIRLKRLSGSLNQYEADVSFNELSGSINEQEFLASGTLRNLLPALFDKKNEVIIKANVFSNAINLNKLMLPITSKSENKDTSGFSIPEYQAQIQITASNVIYKQIEGSNVRLNVDKTANQIKIHKFSANTLGGNISLSGSLTKTVRDSTLLVTRCSIRSVNINDFFKRLNNFDQEQLTAENIRGTVTAEVELKAMLDKEYEFNKKSVESIANIEVINGELINYKPIMALSRFVKLSELQDVKFSALKNKIFIHNSVIAVPEMEINSSALNLTASGTHTFENIIDYRLRISLMGLLGKKVKDRNTEFGEIEEEKGGRTTLPLAMTGHISNPKIRYDKQTAAKSVKNSLKREGQTLKELFKKEFSSNKLERKPVNSELAIEEKEIDINKTSVKPVQQKKEEENKPKSKFQKLKDKLKGEEIQDQ